MAIHFHNGDNHKNYLPVPPPIYGQAVSAAKTYDWVEEPVETSAGEDSSPPEPPPEYPKKFKCSKTGLIATRQRANDAVMFVRGELLTLTADEQTVKDIIE